jgi:phage shock protein C
MFRKVRFFSLLLQKNKPINTYNNMASLKLSSNKMIAGVAAGVAEYLGVDATVVRIIWALLILCAGTGLIAYFIVWIILAAQK